jgi:DnaK suppressor protein
VPTASDPDRAASVLDAKAGALRAELAGLTEAPEDFGTIQFGKRAGDATNVAAEQLSRVSAHEQLLAVLGEVERAQAKLDDGTYGFCDRCEREIGEARLEALPWATECVGCRNAHDRRR